MWIDLETYSAVPIKQGTYKYAENCEVMVVSYAFGTEPWKVWDVTAGKPMPGDLEYVLKDTDEPVVAHNAMFDRTVLNRSKNLRVPIALTRWRCTMVRALAHSLPGALAALCEILNVQEDKQKLKIGRELLMLFCKPRPKTSKIERATRFTHPVEWARFLEYAGMDIEAMREVAGKLPEWNYREQELALWHLDQKINDRGFCVDTALAGAAVRAVDREQKLLAQRTQKLTDYDEATGAGVASTTQRDQLLAHILAEYGVDLPDMQMSTLERRIADPDLPSALRELLGIRLQATTTSTSKYTALLKGVNADGRLRGTKQFDGAARTGRWAGRVFQPDNLPRPAVGVDIGAGIDALLADCADLLVENTMQLASSAIRGVIVSPKGKKLCIGDLSNIEGRGLVWLAGEEWKLQAFRDFDAGSGADLYKLSYAKSFKVDPDDVTKDQRQVGKVQELALGYEGGVGAFVTFAAAYSLDLEEMAATAWATLPGDAVHEAEGFLEWCHKEKRPTFGLSDKAFIVCDSFKRLWRRAHPQVALLWRDLKETCIAAVENPGNTFDVRALKIRCDGAWLRIRLPSGRYLCYPSPRVKSDALTYMGISQYTKKWQRIPTYGGKLAENITQAFARDILAYNQPLVEAAGYEIVLHVHDENITETPNTDDFSVGGLCALMATVPAWAEGLPLAAAGFETYRYRKE